MTTNQYQEDWFTKAPGQFFDPDGVAGFQCVDAAKAYFEGIFGVGWKQGWPGAGNACDMLYTYDPEYFQQIINDPADPNLLPERGDVIIYGGNAYNPAGHIAVVLGADTSGVDVLQQDGGLQCACFEGRLAYTLAGAGACTGWLRPKFDPPAAAPATTALAPNVRQVSLNEASNERDAPSTSGKVQRVASAGSFEQFTGYVHGETVTANGFTSDVWFADGTGYEWCGNFEDQSTTGLPNLTTPTSDPHLRKVGAADVRQRDLPYLDGSTVVRTITGGTTETFDRFTHGESVTLGGLTSDVWYFDGTGYAWAGGFESQATDGLTEVPAPPRPVAAPPAAPAPSSGVIPAPAPVSPVGPILDVIDVGKDQPALDLGKVRADAVVIAVTAGMDAGNPLWKAQADAAIAAGLEVGFYHIRNWGNATPQQEADRFLDQVHPYLDGTRRVFLDWEECDTSNTSWAEEFRQYVKRVTGLFDVGLYLGQQVEKNNNWSATAADGELPWVAQYPYGTRQDGFVHWDNPPALRYFTRPGMWQYTSHGRLAGYDGDLDLSAFYGTREDWRALGGITPVTLHDAPAPPALDPRTVLDAFMQWQISSYLANHQ